MSYGRPGSPFFCNFSVVCATYLHAGQTRDTERIRLLLQRVPMTPIWRRLMKDSEHLVIIGNGITGISCALEVRRKSACKITVISDEGEYFFSRPALMYVFLKEMQLKDTQPYEKKFWKKQRIDLRRATVTRIDTVQQSLTLEGRESLHYDRLVLATGSEPNKFGWPGQDLPGVQGFYSLQDLSLIERNAVGIRRAVIVGGGLIGVEVAEMLRSRGIGVTFLIREKFFWQIVLPQKEAELVGAHVAKHGVDMRYESELASIEAGADGRVVRVVTKAGENIDCGLVALTAGVSPNIALARASAIATGRGILVSRRFETNAVNVFAAGDCAEFREPIPGRRPVEQVWYTGKQHGETLGKILCGEKCEYAPGTWFNSAKFFHLEYQVYGDVPANLPASMESFYWENSSASVCLRVNWHKADRALCGMHAIGMRLRADVVTRWIEDRLPVHEAVRRIAQANFDPEFFKNYSAAIGSEFSEGQAVHA